MMVTTGVRSQYDGVDGRQTRTSREARGSATINAFENAPP
jgi:hypothetical protein